MDTVGTLPENKSRGSSLICYMILGPPLPLYLKDTSPPSRAITIILLQIQQTLAFVSQIGAILQMASSRANHTVSHRNRRNGYGRPILAHTCRISYGNVTIANSQCQFLVK